MRNPILTLLLSLLLGSSLPLPASAQKQFSQLPASTRTLIAINVTGSKRYSEQTIAAGTGLHLGTPVTEDDFKSAARRLGIWESSPISDIRSHSPPPEPS